MEQTNAEGPLLSDISTNIVMLIEPYGGEVTADAQLVIAEETSQQCADGPNLPPAKRLRTESCNGEGAYAAKFNMPAHRAVLWPLSEYFASKFRNWSGNEGKPQITLLVPAGQLNIGKALVATIYDKIPTNLSQQHLLQLLVLAESYRINKVSAAVANSITSIPQDKLQWQTVLAMEQLPAAEPLYKPLIAAAKARHFQLLGDLEMVWALEGGEQRRLLQQQLAPGAAAAEARAHMCLEAEQNRAVRYLGPSTCRRIAKELLPAVRSVEEAAAAAAHSSELPHELLLQLPFDSLVQLLESRDIKAESENTVHYTITRWLEQHPEVTSTEQLKRLASLIHLSHCTPGYFAKRICAEGSWLLPLYPARLLVHSALASASWHGTQPVQPRSLQWDGHLNFQFKHERRASALRKLNLTWNVPLSDIQRELQQAVNRPMMSSTYTQPHRFHWQGAKFSLSITVVADDRFDDEEDEEREPQIVGVTVCALYVNVHADDDEVAFASQVDVWKALPRSSRPLGEPYLRWKTAASERRDLDKAYILIDTNLTSPLYDVEGYAPHCVVDTTITTWEELESLLRERRLIFADNCLHITAEISKVV